MSLSLILSSVLAYVWHCMLFFFCFFLFFSTQIYLQHIARPVESDRPINIVFVRPSGHPQSVYECRAITLQPLGIDLCNFKI